MVKPQGNKSARLELRLTDEERRRLSDIAHTLGCTRSEAIRRLISQSKLSPPPPPRPICDQRVLNAIQRIGTNINQIARELHRHDRHQVTHDEFLELNRALMVVAAAIAGGDQAVAQLRENDVLTAIIRGR